MSAARLLTRGPQLSLCHLHWLLGGLHPLCGEYRLLGLHCLLGLHLPYRPTQVSQYPLQGQWDAASALFLGGVGRRLCCCCRCRACASCSPSASPLSPRGSPHGYSGASRCWCSTSSASSLASSSGSSRHFGMQAKKCLATKMLLTALSASC